MAPEMADMQHGGVWYHLYPLGFLDAEPTNAELGGERTRVVHRLPRLLEWLDYLVELGITGLLLGPIWQSETHGYDVVDPFSVDRRLGNENDVRQLIDACHQRSLRVALDGVFHHVGRGHPYFRDVLEQRQQSAWRDWFLINFEKPGRDGFAYADFEGHHQLVKLNHLNRAVVDWAVDVARAWLEQGVDGFRLDAVYAIPTVFVAEFAARLRAVRPDLLLLGEVIHGDYPRIARAMQLSTLTQYELWKAIWSSLNDGNLFELAHALQRHADFCREFPPWNFVGNHDTTRIYTQLGDRRHLGHALAILFTVPGIPAIYAGDEQGAGGRKYHRVGGDAKIRRPPPFRPGEVAGQSLDIWSLHRDLIAVRRQRPWLERGQLSVTSVKNHALTFEVRAGANHLVTALNIGDQFVDWALPAGFAPVAGQTDARLGPHTWGVWDSP
jgi:cyclomaltodextrinase